MTGQKPKCTVRDGRFVEPCGSLSENMDNPAGSFGRAKGVTRWDYTNLKTHQPSRTFFGVKSKAFPKGHLFNFCPFCGEGISAPFMSDEEGGAS